MLKKISKIIDILSQKYPDPETALNYSSPFELLIAVILSAQTTDKQVNKVTAKLFKEYNTPSDFSSLEQKELQEKLKNIGLFRNKSKYIIETANIIENKYNSKVPHSREELMKLPGVGRKTANVVLSCAFSRNTFPVDTHVFRVSFRLGLASGESVEKTEKELQETIPKNKWSKMHLWLINHGRDVCKAHNPDCKSCSLKDYCMYYDKHFN